MSPTRPILRATLKPATSAPEGSGPTAQLVITAIAKKLCLTATYNKTVIRLAPHILYTRHDDLIVDAVVLERDGAKPKLIKIGAFRLSGLGGLALTPVPFDRNPAFDPANPTYAENIVAIIAPA
ncbi:MAG TPA: hypothetical protein VF649_07215 [Sphingomonas sp.]|jgi:hypothetical protein|uniref:hypothetical protein n=1 Tax=Sphingomonas sp. TaxID=28214 RepID=UPI002EDB4E7A